MEGIEKNGLGKVIFLKGILLNIMDNYETNFSKKGQNTLKKFPNNEHTIDYSNLFLKASNLN